MSKEVTQFLSDHGVVMTHSTPYHPQGNGQCERVNGTIWKGVCLSLRSQGLPESRWESVLDCVLHSIRSLLCTATNQTPHERLFSFPRKSPNGYSLPSWLSHPGPVLLRKFVKSSKSDPLVEPVELITATPRFVRVRHPDGREATVSTRDLAEPAGTSHFPPPNVVMEPAQTSSEAPTESPCLEPRSSYSETTQSLETTPDSSHIPEAVTSPPLSHPLRRSTRENKPVIRYPM